MARNHLRFSVDAWRDDDWLDLSRDAQWLFTTMLSQPRMTLVGAIDVNVQRWAGLSRGETIETTQPYLDELEERGFVIVDRRTSELVVRSFTKNDLAPGRISQQIAKGFWSAWKGIASADLRRVVVNNCPDDVWEKVERHAPEDALQMRRSSPIDREPPPPIDSEREAPIDNPPTGSLPPDAGIQQPAAGEDAAAADHSQLISDAIEVLVDRTMKRRPAKENPHGYAHALREGKRADHWDHAVETLEAWGVMPAEELAFFLEPHLFPAPPAVSLRLVRERCKRCSDTTWLNAELDPDGNWLPPAPCPDCNKAVAG